MIYCLCVQLSSLLLQSDEPVLWADMQPPPESVHERHPIHARPWPKTSKQVQRGGGAVLYWTDVCKWWVHSCNQMFRFTWRPASLCFFLDVMSQSSSLILEKWCHLVRVILCLPRQICWVNCFSSVLKHKLMLSVGQFLRVTGGQNRSVFGKVKWFFFFLQAGNEEENVLRCKVESWDVM